MIKKLWLLLGLAIIPSLLYGYDFVYDGLAYNIVSASNQTVEVTSNDNAYEGDISIPEKVEYKGHSMNVIGIGENAFKECTNLRSISFPEKSSFRYIGYYAFGKCTSLTEIVIPNNVDSIAEFAFQGCSNAVSISLPKTLRILDKYVLSMMPCIKNIQLPDSLQAIKEGVFWQDFGLESIIIPANVKEIGMSAFKECSNLSFLNFEDGKDPIYKYAATAAEEFSSVKKLYLGRNIKPIGYYINFLYNIENVTNLIVGKYVSDITWVKTSNLSEVTLYSVVPPKTNTFSEKQYTELTIKVPQEAIESYKVAEVWKNFWNIEGVSTGISRILEEPSHSLEYYYINGSKATSSSKGLIIFRNKKGKSLKIIKH